MNTQSLKPRPALAGKWPASAFAALLLLVAGAPAGAGELTQSNTENSSSSGSGGSSSGGSVSSSTSSHSSGGHSGGGYSGDRGSHGGGGGGGYHGDRGGHGEGRGHGDGRGYGDGRGRGRGHGHGHGGYRGGGYWGGYGWGGYGGWGWGGWWPWWYPGWGGPTVIVETGDYGYGYGYGEGGSGALDIDISPEKTQVFVDGNYVGTADDYDGFPTFLWLERGTYDVAFYLPGYQTIVRQYTVRPGAILDVEDHMTPGESIPPEELMRPKSTERRDARIERNAAQEAEVDRLEAAAAGGRDGRPGSDEKVGRLYLSLWPPDAAIYLDGHFLGTAEEIGQLSAGLVVEPGDHQLEVVRPGFATVHRQLTVPAGERVEIKFDLDKN